MVTIRESYNAVDIHKKEASLWPAVVPPLTADEAVRAVSRLWRFSMGEACPYDIYVTSGNRYNWVRRFNTVDGQGYPIRKRRVLVNPSKGWKHFIHNWSHYFVEQCNPGEGHSKFHARFEAKLVKQVIKRGWLEGKLKTH